MTSALQLDPGSAKVELVDVPGPQVRLPVLMSIPEAEVVQEGGLVLHSLSLAEAEALAFALIRAAQEGLARTPRPRPTRITRQKLARLLADHNLRTGARFNPERIGVTHITLWDGSELLEDGGSWYLRPAPGHPLTLRRPE